MVKKTRSCNPLECCKVEAIVGVDERGQMVLPKEVREKARIRAGDKLAVVIWKMGEDVSCVSLVKADEISGLLKEMLGPMFQQLAKK